jgi:hypothetical protein
VHNLNSRRGSFLLEICELKYCFSVGIVNSVHDVIVVEVRPRQISDLFYSSKVHGSHFSNWTTFKVQTAQLTCYVLNVSLASCLIPHKFHFQPVNKLIVSSDNGLTWSSSWAEFEFVVAAAVHQIEPSVVVEGQVTSVTVVGNGFSGGSGVVCGLGDMDALSGRWLSAERVVCNVIGDRVGYATLRVSSNGGLGVEWWGGAVCHWSWKCCARVSERGICFWRQFRACPGQRICCWARDMRLW